MFISLDPVSLKRTLIRSHACSRIYLDETRKFTRSCGESKHSLFLEGARLTFNYVGDSVLGSNVNLGAGVKLSNLRNDGQGLEFDNDVEEWITSLEPFSVMIQLGCNGGDQGRCLENLLWSIPTRPLAVTMPMKASFVEVKP